jgi:hypothetical protein
MGKGASWRAGVGQVKNADFFSILPYAVSQRIEQKYKRACQRRVKEPDSTSIDGKLRGIPQAAHGSVWPTPTPWISPK